MTKAEYLRLLDAAKCAPPADPGRQHGDDCYEKVRGERACTLSTEPAQPELICGKREIVPHEHASACQGSCGKTQAPDTCNRRLFPDGGGRAGTDLRDS